MRLFVCCLAVLTLYTGSVALAGGTEDDPCFVLEEDAALDDALKWSRDIEWAPDGRLIVASSGDGVFALDRAGSHPPQKILGRGSDDNSVWLPFLVAASRDHLVVSSPVFSIAWKRLDGGRLSGQVAFDAPTGLDLNGDRVAVLGFRKGERGRPAPDGAIAWVGHLSAGLDDLTPVLYSADGPGALRMLRGALLRNGQLRFLDDGSLVIVPGVEPGVYQFDAKGSLVHTWQSNQVGVDPVPQLTEEQFRRLNVEEEERWRWVNRGRTVDEILPLAAGPALVIRERTNDTTRWDLVLLRHDAEPVRCRLPFTSPSDLTRLSADVHGKDVAVLLWGNGKSALRGAEPAHQPRLLFGHLTGGFAGTSDPPATP